MGHIRRAELYDAVQRRRLPGDHGMRGFWRRRAAGRDPACRQAVRRADRVSRRRCVRKSDPVPRRAAQPGLSRARQRRSAGGRAPTASCGVDVAEAMSTTSDPAARAAAILEIDLAGIAANWRLLARQAAPARCAAVVKANGYGLGAAPVALALAAAGCRMFFVATLDEGIALRHALGEVSEIAVFNGPLPGTAAEFAAHQLIPVLNTPGQIEEWASLRNSLSALQGGEGGDPSRSDGEGEVGARSDRGRLARMRPGRPRSAWERSGIPHLNPTLSAPSPLPNPPPLAGEGRVGALSAPSPLPNPPPLAGEGRVGALSAPGGGEGARDPRSQPPPAILHVDTGMARLGLDAGELAAIVENPPPFAWRAVMSHLACADRPDHALNER